MTTQKYIENKVRRVKDDKLLKEVQEYLGVILSIAKVLVEIVVLLKGLSLTL